MRSSRRAVVTAALSVILAATLSACGLAQGAPSADASAKTSIKIGFNPGPYQDMFEGGIAPILAKEGFQAESVSFTDGIVVNVAVANGEIDANIMQHPVYMDAINQQENIHNAALVQVPTPPMALFGGKKSSLDAVADGDTVAVPNAPSNMYRAFKVLEQVGWITLKPDTQPAITSPADIATNPHGIQIVALENAQQVPSLQDVAYSVIQGNFVVSGGLKLTAALALENLADKFSVVVAVDEKNLDTPWAKAIAAAYASPEFASYISSHSEYDGYHLPAALQQK